MKQLPQVVIIGRINVGKSALFNRLTETSRAIVSNIPGTTRDYNQAEISWQKKTFQLIDTGGIDSDLVKNSIASLVSKKIKVQPKTDNPIEIAIVNQTKLALKKADLILLVADGQVGPMPQDKELAKNLQTLKIPILLVCNKVDGPKWRNQTAEFFSLGLGQPIPVSAINGSGTGDLLDQITGQIKGRSGRPKTQVDQGPDIKVAIVGKPNAGKSSLINKILGEQRVIVSPIAQTTREPQDTTIVYKDLNIVLIDTAGLRKKGKISAGIEKKAAGKTLKMIKNADVVLLITEIQAELTAQESRLAGLIKDANAGIIIVGNKWDLLQDKDNKIDKEMINYYRRFFPYLSFAPLIFVSAQTGKNVEKILDLIVTVWQQRKKTVDQDQLELIGKKLTSDHRPVQAKGLNRPRIYRLEQTASNPPVFTVTIGKDQSLHFSYLRFIENKIRQSFDFLGVPITMKVRAIKK